MTVAAEKKKKKVIEMPKAEVVPLSSLMGKGAIPVHFHERPNPLNAWDKSVEALPKLGVITDMTPHTDKKHLRVTYYTGKGQPAVCFFPTDFPMRMLTGSIGKAMAQKYEQREMITFKNAHYSGMIGSDPEIFVESPGKGVIPAFDFLGSKATPDKTAGRRNLVGPRQNMYWDGFQAEFTTEANTCLAWHADSVRDGLESLYQKARKHDKDAILSALTVAEIPIPTLEAAKEEHVELGCMPSYNVYGLSGLRVPARQLTSRSAGGHIHFGIGKKDPETIANIVKALDGIMGVSCVAMFAKYDNPARRQFYGLPGEFRLPPHGLEYRVLSNAWLFHPLIMNLVFDLSRRALLFGEKGLYAKHFKATEEEVIDTIRNCDVPKAQEIMDRNQSLIKELIASCGGYYPNVKDRVFSAFRNGMETLIKDPTDIAKNWYLGKTWTDHCNGKGCNVAYNYAQIAAGDMF